MVYTIKEIKFGKNKTMYIPVFNDSSLAIMQEFLSSEVINFKNEILSIIENAKTNSEIIQFAGNVCLLSIVKGRVKIECAIDDVEIGNPVEIGLEEFEQVVNSWITDLQNRKNKAS